MIENKPVIKKKQSLIWLSKQGIYFYVQDAVSILAFAFSPEFIKYFDVVNQPKFSASLESFFKQNNIPSLDAHMIIGPDALIEKEFANMTDEQMQEFLDLIPYEKVFSKKVPKEKSTLVCAFNAEFYYQISSVLEKSGGGISTVTPYFSSPVAKFDSTNAQTILKNTDLLKKEDMINYGLSNTNNTDALVIQEKPKEEKSTLPILLPVFFVMLLILGIVYYVNIPKPVKPKIIPTNSINPISAIVPTSGPLTNESTTSAALKDSFKIKILYSTSFIEKATLLKNTLISKGYTNLQLTVLSGVTSSEDTVIFQPKLSADVKQEISNATSNLMPGTVSKEDPTITDDIDITITK